MWHITQKQYEYMLHGPALLPPKGVKPNLENPQSLNAPAIAVASVALPLTTFVLALRLYTKVKILRHINWEDYVSVGAWVTLIGYYVVGLCAHHHAGVSIHQWDMTLKIFEQLVMYYWVNSLIYCVTVFLIKMAILLQYMTLFASARTKGFTYWASHGLIWTNAVFYVTIFFLIVFNCTPIDKTWHRIRPGGGRCWNTGAMYIAMAVFNTISDFAILLVPQRVVWRLKMSTKRKSGLSAIFLIGVVACIASLLRLYYSAMVAKSDDYTYWAGLVGLTNYFEMWAGITATCLPVLPRFFQAISGRRPARQAPSYDSNESDLRKLKHWPSFKNASVPGLSSDSKSKPLTIWSSSNPNKATVTTQQWPTRKDSASYARIASPPRPTRPPRTRSDPRFHEDRKYGIRPSFYDASNRA